MAWWKNSAGPRTVALLIVLFFMLDRSLSVGYILPGFCVEDERWIQEGAVKMVQEASLDPGTHKYPGLMFILTSGVYGAAYIATNAKALMHFESLESFSWHRAHYEFPFSSTIVWGRMLSAVLGAASLMLFFGIFRREFGDDRALVGMLFLATSPAFLYTTMLLKNDGLLLFGVLLAIAASLRIHKRGSYLDYTLGGMALGFCLAAKYHPVALLPLLFAHRFHHGDESIGHAFMKWRWLLIGPAALLVFAALSPWTWLELQGTIEQMGQELAIQNRLNPLFMRSSKLWWHKPVLFQFSSVLPFALGIPLYLLAMGGVILRADLKQPRKLIVWSYPAGFIAFMIAMSELGVPHLYAPVLPFFALFAAIALGPWLSSGESVKRAGAMALVCGIVLYNLLFFHNSSYQEEFILVESVSFMEKTHQPGERDIALVPYFPDPDKDWSVEFAPQFMLSRKHLDEHRPDRLLVHHAYYHSFLDNPRMLANPGVKEMVVTFLELRAGKLDYKLAGERFAGDSFTASWYRTLLPDLEGMRVEIYERNEQESPVEVISP